MQTKSKVRKCFADGQFRSHNLNFRFIYECEVSQTYAVWICNRKLNTLTRVDMCTVLENVPEIKKDGIREKSRREKQVKEKKETLEIVSFKDGILHEI